MSGAEVAQIAAKLTKAQRECVMVLSDEFQRPPRGRAYWAATMTYGDKLTQFRYETWDSRNRIYRLTPLGQQVRAHLMSVIRKPTDIATDDNRLSQETPA